MTVRVFFRADNESGMKTNEAKSSTTKIIKFTLKLRELQCFKVKI